MQGPGKTWRGKSYSVAQRQGKYEEGVGVEQPLTLTGSPPCLVYIVERVPFSSFTDRPVLHFLMLMWHNLTHLNLNATIITTMINLDFWIVCGTPAMSEIVMSTCTRTIPLVWSSQCTMKIWIFFLCTIKCDKSRVKLHGHWSDPTRKQAKQSTHAVRQ